MNFFWYNEIGDTMNKKRIKSSKEKYPVIECLEARFGTEEIIELVLGVVLTFFGFISPIICFLMEWHDLGHITPPSGLIQIFIAMFIAFSLFGIIGIIFLVGFFKSFSMYLTIKKKGRVKTAVVCEYIDDDSSIDGFPNQVVKLFIEDKKRPIIVYYQLGSSKQPYAINSRIKIKMYRKIFRIIEE